MDSGRDGQLDAGRDSDSDAVSDAAVDADTDSSTDTDSAPDAACATVTYAPPVAYPIGCWVSALAIGDVTGDGLPDLVVSDMPSSSFALSVVRNLGGRAFSPETSYTPADPEVKGIAVADFDGDGRLDVMTSDRWSATVGVYLQDGSGDLRAPMAFSAGPRFEGGVLWTDVIAAADLDGDGLPDVALAEQDLDTQTGGGVGVFLNRQGRALASEVLYPSADLAGNMGGTSARGPTSIAIADVNGDGRRDIVIAKVDEQIGVYLNAGGGTFAPEMTYPVGVQGPSGDVNCRVGIGDFDGDGHLDLAASNWNLGPDLGVLLGDGTGTFAPEVAVDTGDGGGPYMAVADLNRDGRDDVVMSSVGGVPGVSTYLELGGVTFGPPAIYSLAHGDFVVDVEVSDLDGDGLPDIAVASQDTCQVEVLYARCQ